MTAVTVDELRPIDLFDDLDDDALAEWAAAATRAVAVADEVIVAQGQVAPGLILLLRGTTRGLMLDGDRLERTGNQVAPTWMGAIAALSDEPLGIQVEAEVECEYALVRSPEFLRLAFKHPAVHRRVMQRVGPVMARMGSVEANRERLASLGTMAAGLAHELNNPAAAAQRASADLAETLDTVATTLERFVGAGIERDVAAQLLHLHRQALDTSAACTMLSALDAADAEDELADEIAALGVEEGWRLAEPLARAGVDAAWLAAVAELAGPATGDAIRWTASTIAAHELTGELQEATRRMSDLVGAVKTYAYMDRGDLVEVDLHEGLEATLTVLGHKLKPAAITVLRDYDRDLPKLSVHGSQLNQVWTNLLDNAIDALDGTGTITVSTRRDGPCALVEIADDGPGIPAEAQDRLFDAFYTTKEVGKGTGLGLATAMRVVSQTHGGSLTVDSEPGRTVFHVWIPFTTPDGVSDMPETCTHLDDVKVTDLPETVDGCPDCIAAGAAWCHLRICLACGHVGCCDDSPGHHATTHYETTGHPIMRSIEPGEDWSWCFADELGMRIPQVTGSPRIPPSPMGC